jgi:hypothetical protein
MRTTLTAALFAAALLVPAHAQERRPTSQELGEFTGQYTLADGRVLNVTQRGRHLVAKVEGEEAVQLAPAGPARFVAPGSGLQLTFAQHENGNVTGVVVDLPVAQTRQAGR